MNITTKTHRVFCIGFMKTGTTTLNRALTVLGYRVSNNSWRWLSAIVRKDWETIQRRASQWDALEDNPIPLIYRELDAMFPGSKFILTVRDQERWFNSVAYHIGDVRSPMHEWLFGIDKGIPSNDKNHSITVFNKHIEAVKAYFKDRPNDLLVLDITQVESWDSLCKFLGEPIPDEPFPHANRTQYSTDKHDGLKARLKYWKKKLFHPLKIEWMRQRGYLVTPEERLRSL